MLSRLVPKPSHFRLVTLLSSQSEVHIQSRCRPVFSTLLRALSTGNGNNNDGNDRSGRWDIYRESGGNFESSYTEDPFGSKTRAADGGSLSTYDDGLRLETQSGESRDRLEGAEKEEASKRVGVEEDDWVTAEGFEPWSLVEDDKDDVFDVEENVGVCDENDKGAEMAKAEEEQRLQKEEEKLTAVLKGPQRAFGDLIAASRITEEMLDSLIALKDFQGVDGLPPLSEIENMRYEKNTRKSTRAEIERKKQEEIAKSRVRRVDENGKAYGTGRRKCSVARVWIQPGDGKFLINDKEFDVYFPTLDHRAALLRPFTETKTLGLWDVKCTVKGGGTTGQVGAIQLGVSRALQNWEPDLRPSLRNVGFLTRDPRVVERKKPGKAKARKSFQWVKR